MKKNTLSQIFFSLLFILFTNGCSNDFLKEQPGSTDFLSETIYLPEKTEGVQQFTLSIIGVKNAHYEIRQFPRWLKFQSMEGNFSNSEAILFYTIDPSEFLYPGSIRGHFVLDIKGVGLVGVNVVFGQKNNPEILTHIEPNKLSFEK